jgi:hypothetical protein
MNPAPLTRVKERSVAALEQRLSYLEGRMEEHSNLLTGTRGVLLSLDRRMLRLEEALDAKVGALDLKIDTKIAALDHKLDQRFAWMIGLQVTTILAFVSAVAAILKH